MSLYEPGRRLAGDDSRKPWVDWVLYGTDVGELVAACYVGSALLRQDVDGWWFRYDWPKVAKQRLGQATIDRARACLPPGWPVLPGQEGLL